MPPPPPAPQLPPPRSAVPGPRRPLSAALTFDDLAADLVWPRLLRAGPLALRPARVGLGLVQAVGLMLLASVLGSWVGSPRGADAVGALSARLAGAIESGPASGLRQVRWGALLFDLAVGFPAILLRDRPLAALVMLPAIAVWTALLGGAISRSAACDHAQGVAIPWPQALGFAASRWKSLTLALALPLVLAWALAAGLAVGGWALFSLNVVNVLGGLLWGAFLLAGVLAAVVLVAYAVGHPLLVPGVACEGTDAVDSLQHAYSFVFARPLRLVLYTALLAVQGAVLVAVVSGVLWLGVHFAQSAALVWSGPRGEAVLGVLPGHPPGIAPARTDGPTAAARGLATFWTAALLALPLGVLASYVWSASTVLYLAMRRVVDGQDESDLWMPGMVEGVLAPAARPPAPPGPASEAVSDTGPADET